MMQDNKRIFALVLIMSAVAFIIGSVSIGILYNTAFEEEREHLLESVQIQARLIEAVARFDERYSQTDHFQGPAEATLSQIKKAHSSFKGFGRTGEITMAMLEGDQIRFVLRHRHSNLDNPKPVSLFSKFAEPMRLAVSGKSGTVIGLDYRGKTVLAAYEPVAVLNMGIVAKLDLVEIREPFIKAGGIVTFIGLLTIIAGIKLFFSVSNPILKKIQDNERQLQAIMDNSSAVIFIKDTAGKYLLVNKAFQRIFHFLDTDIAGKTDYDIFPKDIAERLLSNDREVLESRESQQVEETIPHDDGIHTYISTKFILNDGEGRPYAICGLATDITQRKGAEESLQQLKDDLERLVDERTRDLKMEITRHKEAKNTIQILSWRNELILNAAGEGIYGLDVEGRTTFVNPAGARMVGWGREELLGELMHDILHHTHSNGDYYIRDDCPIYATFKDGKQHFVDDEVFWRKDGSYFSVEYLSTPMIQDGEIIGTVVVYRDITERRQAEEQLLTARIAAERANSAKSNFLANMSHEIRTPMNTIINMGYLALQTDLQPKQKNYLNKVHNSAHSLLKILDQILDFSKIEAGKLALESSPMQLEKVLANIANIFYPKAEEKDIELLFEIDTQIPRTLIGDALRLQQVLTNLTDNAIKFTNDGKVGITAKIVHIAPNFVFLRFIVSDTGIGIAESQLDEVFQTFSQADASITRKHGGTGLGLSISKKLVEMMGGRIEVSSDLSKGSKFVFTAAFGCQEPELRQNLNVELSHKARCDLQIQEDVDRVKGARILVVEDDVVSQEVTTEILKFRGVIVELVDNGHKAVFAVAQESHFDAVLMDLSMPEMDGYEAVRRIRKNNKELPIIALTANVRAEEKDKCLAVGMNDYVSKPIVVERLFAVLARWITPKISMEKIKDKESDKKPQVTTTREEQVFDRDELVRLLPELVNALKRNDLQAKEYWEKIRTLLPENKIKEEVGDLDAQIGKLQFKKANVSLQTVINALNISLKEMDNGDSNTSQTQAVASTDLEYENREKDT
jgi:PAS domain S-box-containing protein